MNLYRTFLFARIFNKIAQSISTNIDTSQDITTEDKDSLRLHSQRVQDSCDVLSKWINANVGPVSNNPKVNELKRFIDAMKASSDNMNSKVIMYLDDSNEQNKTISSIDSDMQSVVQNYNAIRPNYIDEGWMTENASSDEAKAMNDIRESMQYIENFSTKAKNAESNSASTTELPDLD